jgi:uncharacterized HAD superfamily protein
VKNLKLTDLLGLCRGLRTCESFVLQAFLSIDIKSTLAKPVANRTKLGRRYNKFLTCKRDVDDDLDHISHLEQKGSDFLSENSSELENEPASLKRLQPQP